MASTFIAAAAVAGLAAPAAANHIPIALDTAGIRTPMPGEGYLAFVKTTASGLPLGEERTGWTDARNPAYFNGGAGNAYNILDRDEIWGYDRSDKRILVNNTVVTHTNNGANPNQTAAAPSARILQDFAYANQIYQQIGISVINESVAGANVNVPNAMAAPPTATTAGTPDSDRVLAANRSANALTINNYYTVGYTGGSPVGFTVAPEDTLAPGVRANAGTILTDAFNRDTFAHELGHFVEDQYRFPGGVHSPNNDDLMATSGGGFRLTPNANTKGSANDAPSHPGRTNGNLGGVDLLGAPMTNPADAVPRPSYNQALAVYNAEKDGNLYVQTRDRANFHGDRADFDWVEDSYPLEDIGGLADNHTGPRDNLYFIKEATNGFLHPGHDHGNFAGELADPDFGGATFKFADVFSTIARYSDNDVDAAGNWSPRGSALDYLVEFSADGTLWAAGTPISVFVDGWTVETMSDDYVARWQSPFDANLLRIRSVFTGTDGHDGNTQIDAVIVASVPEPAGAAAVAVLVTAAGAVRIRRGRAPRVPAA